MQSGRKYLVLLFLLSWILTTRAQLSEQALPYINNFTPKQYTYHNQNWSIEQDIRGVIYFGNNNGLMYFNGNTWDLIDDERIKAVRSIAKDQLGGIYIGSVSEFGYVHPNQEGKFVYVSLSSKYPNETKNISDVWSTLIIDDCIYFCCPEGIFKFKSDVLVKVYKPQDEKTFHKFFVFKNKLIFREKGTGLFTETANGKIKFIQGSNLYADVSVDFILAQHNDTLIGTRKNGVYAWKKSKNNENKFTALSDSLNKEFSGAEIYCGILLHDNTIAIGTSYKGIYFLGKNKKIIRHLDKATGLGDNKVYALFEDSKMNIWSAFDKGIALVEYSSAIKKFDDKMGLDGNVNASIIFKNKLFIATTKGLFVFSKEKAQFELLIKDETNCFSIANVQHRRVLLIGCKKGLAMFDQGIQLVPELENIECKYVYTLSTDSANIFVAGVNFLSTLSYQNGSFVLEQDFESINGKISNIVEENLSNSILVGVENDGVYRYYLKDKKYVNPQKLILKEKQVVSSFYLFKIKKEIYCCSEKGVYSVKNNQLVGSHFLDYYFSKNASDVFKAKVSDKNTLWVLFTYNNALTAGFSTCNGADCSYKYLDKFFGKLHKIQVNDIYFHENEVWFSTNDGLMTYNTNDINFSDNQFNCFVTNVVSKDKIIFYGNFSKTIHKKRYISKTQSAQSIPKIQHFNNSITFDFSTNTYVNTEDNMFQTYLENYEDGFGEWTKDHKKSYTNLDGGKYVFHVRAKDANEKVSEETTFTFYVEYPWYQTPWGITIIVVLGISVLGSITFIYTRFKTKRIEAEKKVLEAKVAERTNELELSNQEVLTQKNNLEKKNVEIDHKNKEITQSIEYALHIQQSILPDKSAIYKTLKDSFVLYKPKDIVSGDFFAFTTVPSNNLTEEIIIAAADCTGHGVPGALMSMLGSNILYQIINEKKISSPSDILYQLNLGVNESLKQNINEGNDGLDIVLCKIKMSDNKESAEVNYAGANRPLYIVRNGMLEEIKATKTPIGGVQTSERIYTNHTINLYKGDIIYLTTDGYADQFGGEFGKKLTTKKFKEFISNQHPISMLQQGKLMDEFFENWRGDNEQVDDVCIIGIRI